MSSKKKLKIIDKFPTEEKFLPQKIGERLGLALVLVGILLFVGFSTVYYFQHKQKTDTILVDIAGRNRMLSQKISYYSELVMEGKVGFKEGLKNAIDLHDNSFYLLKNGGFTFKNSERIFLPPISDNDLSIILEGEKLWVNFREKARIISEYDQGNREKALEALSFIRDNNEGLLSIDDRIVKSYVAESNLKQKTLLKALLFVLVLGLLIIFLIAYIITRIINSIKNLQEGVKIIGDGDLEHRVATDSPDEIGVLSRAFDEMTLKLSLIQKEKFKLLEKSKIELEKKVAEKTSSLREAQDSILSVLVDVKKEKKKLEKAKVKDEAIFKSIGEGLIVLDDQGLITLANEKALEILCCSGNIIGRRWEDVLKLKEEDFIFEDDKRTLSFQKMFVDASEHKIFNFLKVDGSTFPAIVAATNIILDGENIGAVIVFRDVTQEMEVDKAKSEFVSLASHQLRTPLSSINWFSEMLLAGDVGKLNEKQTIYTKEISKSSRRMTNLVNTLLNVSRIELGTMVIAPVMTDIVKIMEDVLDELKLAAQKRKIKLETKFQDNLIKLKVDSKVLRVAFQNLVSNAIKYTQMGGFVKIEIKEDNSSNVLISVEDNGYGIPKKFHDKIFGKLYRADNIKVKDTEGTGLGLYITKSIIEQSGGKIWFESPLKDDKGTKFFCLIPKSGMKAKAGSRELS